MKTKTVQAPAQTKSKSVQARKPAQTKSKSVQAHLKIDSVQESRANETKICARLVRSAKTGRWKAAQCIGLAQLKTKTVQAKVMCGVMFSAFGYPRPQRCRRARGHDGLHFTAMCEEEPEPFWCGAGAKRNPAQSKPKTVQGPFVHESTRWPIKAKLGQRLFEFNVRSDLDSASGGPEVEMTFEDTGTILIYVDRYGRFVVETD